MKGQPGAILPAVPRNPNEARPILPKAPRSAALQRQADNAFALPPGFTLRPRGSGQPLPEPIQMRMESLFHTSFAEVRVHIGPEASSLGALAFTHGADLYFAPGQYNPESIHGLQLLGHELTHVVQQRAGRVRNPLGSGVAVVQDAGLEAEAERMGMRAASAAPPIQAKPAGSGPGADPAVWSGAAANPISLAARVPHLAPVQRKSGPVPPGGRGGNPEPARRVPVLAPIPASAPGHDPASPGVVQPFGLFEIAGLAGLAALGIGGAWALNRLRGRQQAVGPIAERMHFVWLGGRIPNVRVRNILAWRYRMPANTVFRLWVDDNSRAASTTALRVLERQNVEIANIRQLAQRDQRVATAMARLPTVNGEGRVNAPATGALSDIVRLAALRLEGGTYMDSDNLPTGASANLVGGLAPAGFRLGNVGGVLSNDAISAAPGDPFIERYLAAASANLTPERAGVILGGGNAARDAVMNTTGPEALARLPLPDARPLLAVAARYPGAFGEVPRGRLTISDLRNLRSYRELMRPADRTTVDDYLERIGMTAFQREQGNAWLGP